MHPRPLSRIDEMVLRREGSLVARPAPHGLKPKDVIDLLKGLARHSLEMARPTCSQFKVGVAVMTVAHGEYAFRTILGRNYESGNRDSLHAEESIVGQLEEDELIVLAVVVGQHGQLVAPCGQCREWLLSHSVPNAQVLLVEGKKERRVPLAALLPEQGNLRLKRLPIIDDSSEAFRGFQRAIRAMGNSIRFTQSDTPDCPEGVAIERANGRLVPGAALDDPAFHQLHAFENGFGSVVSYGFGSVVRVVFTDRRHRDGQLLFPCGRCRQKLVFLQDLAQREVAVVITDAEGHYLETDPHRLLPNSFGIHDLGLDPAKLIGR